MRLVDMGAASLHPRDDHSARRGGKRRATKSGFGGGGSVASTGPFTLAKRPAPGLPPALPTWEAVSAALARSPQD
jgi:hypothetical protein